jgi:hypothetical protein
MTLDTERATQLSDRLEKLYVPAVLDVLKERTKGVVCRCRREWQRHGRHPARTLPA